MKRMVAINDNGKIEVHAAGGSANYSALCGCDDDDPSLGLSRAPLPKGAKIDCPQCRQLWEAWRQFGEKDFA